MTIKVDETFPSGVLRFKDDEGVKEIKTEEYFDNKIVVLFAVPGAFTPTCSAKHLPGYIRLYDQMKAKGVSSIGCMAVNDPHVMKAWGDVSGVDGKIDMLSDSDCSISKSLGLDMNFGKVLGHRSKRFAMIVDNKVITHLFVEEVGAFEVSTAENILESL
ncbi:peroxiredoxin [Alphaproteobacteria bacterium]|jgi:peroxiredoxin|nr:peroxiredoxin [Alphaproteobacteria bacterium]MDC1209907.1 peroxiredoxin [Pseudomonadota bacterium]|tara:strand:- start:1316 stop:1795 length:480 start_codon:yes stop_codon:yes gene_type:complete